MRHVRAGKVVCFEARLHMQRSDGNALVQRATRVFQMKDFFLVRLKLPCAVSKYELSFHMATVPRAKELAEHPFKHPTQLTELHKLPEPAVAQPFGITICSPIDYAVPYFLVHLHPDCVHSEAVREPTGETPSSLLFRKGIEQPTSNLNGKNDRLRTIREDKLLEDVPGAARFDVVVSEGKTQQQRFAYSLQPNLGFPEFFDGLRGVLHLNENDAGSRIELFFSLTVEEEADKATMKIGEWKAWETGPRPDRKFPWGEGQPVLAKMSGRNTRMAQWLDYRVRVTISDARMLVGTFMAFDKYMNVVLADCEEFRKIKPAQGPKADPVFRANG
ncbi:Small nuclear ribonucleoprotein-associated protein B [Symbiodinium microadriaticum]|uniref:Sm protein B n=1 Tax=Symbiodinium microadriaticum TaxID=2951 RepID=A0A1Q9DBB7_SYMMI|nr:Small nuclear ribonucleoprotein-associated protein B [Symbiodinium microadriaticum]